jgi:competence ComEA-like helix-hairpin-helix protein
MSEYFTFSRKERIGILTIVLLIILIWLFPQIIKPSKSQIPLGDTSWITAIRALERQGTDSDAAADDGEQNLNHLAYDHTGKEHLVERKFSYFDPNTLSAGGWKKLGIREKTIRTIQNYLRKGGRFNKAEDLKKIYGIHLDEFAMLAPYIQIQTKRDTTSTTRSNNAIHKQSFEARTEKILSVEINVADTAAWIALPGIGRKLAARITNFRDKLGGFYSIDQVSETYGLPDSTFKAIKPWLKLENPFIKKININTATKEELKSHPYLRWPLANAIVEYRNQHGNFASIEDLRKVGAITEEVFAKIRPYVSVE